MKIAIIGGGRIGSTFAFHLARAGHDVEVVARGPRLDALQRDQAIIAVNGDRAEAFDVVRFLGHQLRPWFVGAMAGLPSFALTFLIWASSRLAAVRDLGEFGPTEAQQLIDAMTKAAPGRTARLLAIRP